MKNMMIALVAMATMAFAGKANGGCSEPAVQLRFDI